MNFSRTLTENEAAVLCGGPVCITRVCSEGDFPGLSSVVKLEGTGFAANVRVILTVMGDLGDGGVIYVNGEPVDLGDLFPQVLGLLDYADELELGKRGICRY